MTSEQAKKVFSLHIIRNDGERSLVGDNTERFWVDSDALDEEIEIPENENDMPSAYDNWCIGANVDAEIVPRAIFDNAGGVTLQLPGYAHYYADAKQAARDVVDYLKNGDTSDWDGHEPEAMECDPTDNEIRNGGYRVWVIGDDPIDCTWGNIEEFFAYSKNAQLSDAEKIELAKTLISDMRDPKPMSPMVKCDLDSGIVCVESDISDNYQRQYTLGQVSDLGDWCAVDESFDDTSHVALYDQIFEAAEEMESDAE